MIVDNSLSFNTNWQTPQAITTVTVDSTTVIDITGAGSGNAPTMINGYNQANTAIGVDIGQGDGMAIPYVVCCVTTAFVSAGAATLQIVLQGAPDNGSYSPGTWTTYFTSTVFTTAQLAAGQMLFFQVPPRPLSGQPGTALPRFYKLSYTVASATFSAGKFNSGILLNPPNGLVSTLYNSNFQSV
jgi:hypothetical protein